MSTCRNCRHIEKYVGIGNSEMELTKEKVTDLENCFNNAVKRTRQN